MISAYQPIDSPVSPLDPFISSFPSPPPRPPAIRISRATSTASTMTTNTTRQFFKAVYLDSPSLGHSIALESDKVVGGTKPLRVRKKLGTAPRRVPLAGRTSPSSSGARADPTGPRRHRSTLSLPRSPTSPRAPLVPGTLVRNDTTSTNASAHRAISHLFLHAPLSPSPSPPAVHRALARSRHRSSLHLGLGKYDTAIPSPGFSPASSPSPSPHRSYYYTSSRTYRSKPLPLPPVPMTPTRAPRKAAMLLGTDVPLPSGKATRNAEKKALSGKHYRPLPGSTKEEIDHFFGNVPATGFRKPASGSVETRNVFGARTTHQDENGRMWLDVEEEQEFAWLLSNVPSISPPAQAPDLVRDATSSEDDKWSEDAFDMDRFTSVLSLATPKRGNGNSKKADKILGITRGHVEVSWLDLGMDAPLPTVKRALQPRTPRKRVASVEVPHPWSNPSLVAAPALGTSVPAPSLSPLRQTPRAVTAPSVLHRPTPKRSNSDEKKRPPPLTLAPMAPRRDLPILTPTTPHGPGKLSLASPPPAAPLIKIPQLPRLLTPPAIPVTRPTPSETQPVPPPGARAPTTPFVHPRKAPAPAAVPPLPLANVPLVAKKPSLVAMTNPHIPILGFGAAAPRKSSESSWTDEEEQVSWFEPVTPVEEHGEGFRLINASGHGRKTSGGANWLGKIRKVSGRV